MKMQNELPKEHKGTVLLCYFANTEEPSPCVPEFCENLW